MTGAEGSTPPLPFIEVADEEARALFALYPKHIILLDDEKESAGSGLDAELFDGLPASAFIAAARQAEQPAPVIHVPALTHAESVVVAAPAESVVAPPVTESVITPPDAGGSESVGDVDEKRIAEILEAIDLLEADDFVKTGDRAGRPKVKPVVDVLGYDVSAHEIDTAFAKSATA